MEPIQTFDWHVEKGQTQFNFVRFIQDINHKRINYNSTNHTQVFTLFRFVVETTIIYKFIYT